ncbi:MAG: pitrilysin family protein [Bacteroidales bacterium]|nr:pitrilysin family protein [Bacteroidales bacterium]
MNFHTLNNGIRIVLEQKKSAVTHTGLFINIGSRDELRPEDEGTAHFIEHSIFKGTQHRRAYHILNRIDGVGGELNAFTTKEETCLYTSSLTRHLERCLDMLADLIFHATFPQHEIDLEKEVVIEEIDAYQDSPIEQIADDYEELAYAGHPLAHDILGNKRNVRRFSSQHLSDFLRHNYTTPRMVISVVGDVEFRRLVRLCEKYFGAYPATVSAADRSTPPTFRHFNQTKRRRNHQMHVMAGCPAYDAYDPRRVPFSLLCNLLGGPAMNSRLNMSIREHAGFCYTIESQYTPFSDTGLFTVYAGIDAGARDQYIEKLMKELDKVCSSPLTPLQLHAAQQQFIGQMAITSDLALNEMQSIGKSYMVYDKVDTLEEMQQEVLAVTSGQIIEVARDLFAPENFSFLFEC